MPSHIAPDVQVRKESWGLLFYLQTPHKLCFVRSGDWLFPEHFNGTWTLERIVDDITRNTGAPSEVIERSVSKLIKHLASNGIIVDEIC